MKWMSGEVSYAVGGTYNEQLRNATSAWDTIDGLIVETKRSRNSDGVWGVSEKLRKEIS
jgi:hypothetical protein